jgi:glycerate dehydrogenase
MSNSSRGTQIHHVAVTYKAGESNRALIRELFDASAGLSFIFDMQAEERKQALADADVLLTWNLPKELREGEAGLLENVRLIQLMSAGADHVPYAKLPLHITIASNVGAYAGPMAEHVMAMTLALAKNLIREHQNLANGAFNQSRPNRMLRGMVCGILGFGGIGKATATLMRSFGMRINAVNTTGRTAEPVEFIGTLSDLQYILSSSDVVVVSLPLTKRTRGLIGKRELAWMKNDAILINVARGAVTDEEALYEHLKEHPDFKAGIDAWWIEPFTHGVFTTNYPFFTLPNVLGSPHNSAIVSGINEEGTRRAVENIRRFWNNGPVRGVVRREDYR